MTSRQSEIAANDVLLQKEPDNPELLKRNGYLCLNTNQDERALEYGRRLFAVSGTNTAAGIRWRTHAHIILGQAYTHLGDRVAAFSNLEKARVLGEGIRDHDALCSVYNGLGIYRTKTQGDRHSAMEAYTKALAEADSAANPAKRAMVMYNLGALWLASNEAIPDTRFLEMAYHEAASQGDMDLKFNCCVALSGSAAAGGNAGESEKWLVEARNIMRDNALEAERYYLATAEGLHHAFAGRPAKAEHAYIFAMENIDSLQPAMRTNLCLRYGDLLASTGRPRDAIRILKTGLLHAKANETAFDSCALLLSIAHAYADIGELKNAYEYMELHRRTLDNVQKRADESSYMENRVKNDVRLYELQIERQKGQLLKKQRDATMLVAAAAVLVVALVLLLYFYRRKNRLYRSIVKQNRQAVQREKDMMAELEAVRARIPDKDSRSKTDPADKLSEIARQFTMLMLSEKIYTDPDLSLAAVAERLGTNRTYLSRAINQSTGHSFSEVVNQYRIRLAIQLISDTGSNPLLKNIASSVGFKSRSAFYTAFRNITGMTPAQYRDKASEG